MPDTISHKTIVLDTGVPAAARTSRRPPATINRHIPLRMRFGYPAEGGKNLRRPAVGEQTERDHADAGKDRPAGMCLARRGR